MVHHTLLAQPFVSNERLYGNRVNFLLNMRKVSLWFTSPFSHRLSKQVLHTKKILKVKAFQEIGTPLNLFHSNTFYLSKNISINFEKFHCKQFYNLLMEKQTSVPTAVKSWGRNHPNIANWWESAIRNMYQITCDNKLRQFSCKLLHCILVTNKELNRFGIANDVTV